MDLASVHGAMISDIVVDKRPSTGRGKKLTLAQENIIKRLYEEESSSIPEGEVPVKSFWINLVTRFRRYTGREYSWQSAKRKIMGSLNEGGRPNSVQESLPAEAYSNESPIVEPSTPTVPGTPPQRPDSCDKSQSSEKRHQTPMGPPFSKSPEYTELGRSPDVVGEWTRRALFPNAAKSSQNTQSNPARPRLSQMRRRSRSPQFEAHPVYRRLSPVSNNRSDAVFRRLHHQLGSVSNRTSVPGSKPSPPSRVFHARSEMKPVSSKRKISIMKRSSNLLEDEVEGHSRNSQKRQGPVGKSLDDSPYLSGPDELPQAPARISRRRRVSNKLEP